MKTASPGKRRGVLIGGRYLLLGPLLLRPHLLDVFEMIDQIFLVLFGKRPQDVILDIEPAIVSDFILPARFDAQLLLDGVVELRALLHVKRVLSHLLKIRLVVGE